MKKTRFATVVLAFLLIIPGTSVIYKDLIGFYKYKDAMCNFVVPRGNGIQTELLELRYRQSPMTTVNGMQLFSEWSPSGFTNRYELSCAILNLPKGHTAKLCTVLTNTNVREWLMNTSDSGVVLLSKSYGNWEKVKKVFKTDLNLIEGIIRNELPVYFDYSSLSMKHPLGYYIFPLFPPFRNYRHEYGLFGVKAMLSHTELPFLYAMKNNIFFFIRRDGLTAEILYGDNISGSLSRVMFLTGKKGVVTEDLIADVCLCILQTEN